MKKILFMISTINPRVILPSDEELYDFMIDTWMTYLNPYPFEAVQAAIYKYFNERKDQPGPQDILNQIKKFMPADPDAPPSVEEAWHEVNDFIHSHGYMNPPKLEEYSNPAVYDAVSSIGWLSICTDENVAATRAYFYKNYNGYSKRKTEENAVKRITGGNSATFKLIEKVSNSMDMNSKIKDNKNSASEIHPLASDELKTA